MDKPEFGPVVPAYPLSAPSSATRAVEMSLPFLVTFDGRNKTPLVLLVNLTSHFAQSKMLAVYA
jgi:hypothetical protein